MRMFEKDEEIEEVLLEAPVITEEAPEITEETPVIEEEAPVIEPIKQDKPKERKW